MILSISMLANTDLKLAVLFFYKTIVYKGLISTALDFP